MKKVILLGICGILLPFVLFLTACSSPVDGEDEETGYTVTFDKNGGDTEASPQTKTVTPPATRIDALPAQPTRTGYIFTDWNTSADGTGSAFTATTTVSAAITVYAQWQAVAAGAHVVTFDKNGGDTEANPQTKAVTPPATTVGTLPAEPTRSGHTFTGWNTSADGTGSAFTATTTVSATITVYAQWKVIPAGAHTVSFDRNGGDTDAYPDTVSVIPPATTVGTLPSEPTRSGHTFTGWNTSADGTGSAFTATTTVSATITVYAQWQAHTGGDDSIPAGSRVWYVAATGSDSSTNPGNPATPLATVKSALEKIQSAYTGTTWPKNPDNTPQTAFIVISGTITNTSTSSSNKMVDIFGNLYPPIELRGLNETTPGTLDANKNGVVLWIDSNPNPNPVTLGPYLTLTNGYYSSPADPSYGGVYVGTDAVFIMKGGAISGNNINTTSTSYRAFGGGVYNRGTFTMSGGTISDNTVDGSIGTVADASGGGVYNASGWPSSTFTMSGGTISGNTAGSGGGVYNRYGTIFTMSDGTISGNTAGSGGGVYNRYGTIFTMSDGTISGNTAGSGSGGGVYNNDDTTFTMNSGIISGNTASSDGGGVYIYRSEFFKNGGVIYGKDDSANQNSVESSGRGDAVFVENSDSSRQYRYRNTTAGEQDNIDSSTDTGLSATGVAPFGE